jgi:hypothetical protein
LGSGDGSGDYSGNFSWRELKWSELSCIKLCLSLKGSLVLCFRFVCAVDVVWWPDIPNKSIKSYIFEPASYFSDDYLGNGPLW